jgi:hypothetical protein
MIAATFLAVFFVPVFYVVIQRLNEWKSPQTSQSTEILAIRPDGEILTAGSH